MVEDFLQGHHCSEMIFAKLGQYYDPEFDPKLMRLATGFGGGIAESADVCGALAGGVMLIGYLYGRAGLDESQDKCWRYCRTYRERFLAELGGTTCFHFTQGRFNPENHRKCAEVVRQAADILLNILPPPTPMD
jgi:C_GCAxxG_C_C family probable redox protein